jgi:hypothetical protein
MLTSFLARGDHLRASPCQHLPAYSDVLRRFGRLIVGLPIVGRQRKPSSGFPLGAHSGSGRSGDPARAYERCTENNTRALVGCNLAEC